MMSRKGKIARLPLVVREALNRQMRDGSSQKEMVAWLNTLPVVREVLARQFGGWPIVKQNLSAWRHGGYEEWALCREAVAQALCGGPSRSAFAEATADKLVSVGTTAPTTTRLVKVVNLRVVKAALRMDKAGQGNLRMNFLWS
jgi:hypothetical protein